jgi:hypothetical protein
MVRGDSSYGGLVFHMNYERYERYMSPVSPEAIITKLLMRYINGSNGTNPKTSKELSEGLGTTAEDTSKTTSESTIG